MYFYLFIFFIKRRKVRTRKFTNFIILTNFYEDVVIRYLKHEWLLGQILGYQILSCRFFKRSRHLIFQSLIISIYILLHYCYVKVFVCLLDLWPCIWRSYCKDNSVLDCKGIVQHFRVCLHCKLVRRSFSDVVKL